jgi:8-amino-7-oxononanoate synthase
VFHVKRSTPLDEVAGELGRLEQQGLLRRPAEPPPSGSVTFCSNDYLGLADRSCTGKAGSGASRLVSGDRPEHRELESALATWLDLPSALLFTSGYAANVGALGCLASEGDLIVSDALNHASIIDGARLSRATVVIVPHLDADAVAAALRSSTARRRWVVTESYFSMDADTPDLARLRAICDDCGAGLYVDEAHALGVLGPAGRGLCAAAGIGADVLVGTMGKAFGASGAFVAGGVVLTRWLWNRARSFVFSTGVSPVVARAGLAGLRAAQEEPALRERALASAAALREGLMERGISAAGWGHVVPWMLGTAEASTRMAAALTKRGILVAAIRPPSVAVGHARLRFTATARHSMDDVGRALDAVSWALSSVSRET